MRKILPLIFSPTFIRKSITMVRGLGPVDAGNCVVKPESAMMSDCMISAENVSWCLCCLSRPEIGAIHAEQLKEVKDARQ